MDGAWCRRDGVYVDRMARTDAGWRIARRRFTTLLDTGDVAILEFDWEG